MLWSLLGCVSGGSDLPTFVVERAAFDVTLAIPGELEAVHSVTLSAPDLNGQIKVTWVVEEGARVKEGDVLVRFDETELQDRIEEAQNTLDVAETKISQRRAALSVRLGDLENGVTSSRLQLQRAQMRLTDSETVPRIEREAARIDVEEAQLSVEKATAALESGKIEGEAELELLRLEAQQAKKQLDLARRALLDATVKAPSAGIVVLPEIWKGGSRGPIAAGDSLWGGSTLVTLPDLSEMQVEAWVHEVDAGKVAVGQPVSVVIDAHPDPQHKGEISKVADLAVKRERAASVKHLQVSVKLDETTPDMKPGMTVRAEIGIDHKEGVLSIPQEAIFYDQDKTYVYRQSFGGWRRADVTLGTTNDTRVIVEGGLDEGDVVALIDPTKPTDAPTPVGTPARSAKAPAKAPSGGEP